MDTIIEAQRLIIRPEEHRDYGVMTQVTLAAHMNKER